MTKRSQKCVQLSGQSTASKHRRRALNVRSTRRNKKQPRRRPWKIRTRRRQQTSVVRTKEHGTSHRLGGTVDATMKFINHYFKVCRVWLHDKKILLESPTGLSKYESFKLKIYLFMSKTIEEIQVNTGEVSEYLVPNQGRFFWYSCTDHAKVSECKIEEKEIPRFQLDDVLSTSGDLNNTFKSFSSRYLINDSDENLKQNNITFTKDGEDGATYTSETKDGEETPVQKLFDATDSDSGRKSSMQTQMSFKTVLNDYPKVIRECYSAFTFPEEEANISDYGFILTFDLSVLSADLKKEIQSPLLWLSKNDYHHLVRLLNKHVLEIDLREVDDKENEDVVTYQFASAARLIRGYMHLEQKTSLREAFLDNDLTREFATECTASIAESLPFFIGSSVALARKLHKGHKIFDEKLAYMKNCDKLDLFLDSINSDSQTHLVMYKEYENTAPLSLFTNYCVGFEDGISTFLLENIEGNKLEELNNAEQIAKILDVNNDDSIDASELGLIHGQASQKMEDGEFNNLIDSLFTVDKTLLTRDEFIEKFNEQCEDLKQKLLKSMNTIPLTKRICRVVKGFPITYETYKNADPTASGIIFGVIKLLTSALNGFEVNESLVVLLQVGFAINESKDKNSDSMVSGIIARPADFAFTRGQHIIDKIREKQDKSQEGTKFKSIKARLKTKLKSEEICTQVERTVKNLAKKSTPSIMDTMNKESSNSSKVHLNNVYMEMERIKEKIRELELRIDGIDSAKMS